VMATRYSWFLTSAGMPIRMIPPKARYVKVCLDGSAVSYQRRILFGKIPQICSIIRP
jgi:hypothetical protein